MMGLAKRRVVGQFLFIDLAGSEMMGWKIRPKVTIVMVGIKQISVVYDVALLNL